jgi:hypothetical protein
MIRTRVDLGKTVWLVRRDDVKCNEVTRERNEERKEKIRRDILNVCFGDGKFQYCNERETM